MARVLIGDVGDHAPSNCGIASSCSGERWRDASLRFFALSRTGEASETAPSIMTTSGAVGEVAAAVAAAFATAAAEAAAAVAAAAVAEVAVDAPAPFSTVVAAALAAGPTALDAGA